jgi:hypothetical protein
LTLAAGPPFKPGPSERRPPTALPGGTCGIWALGLMRLWMSDPAMPCDGARIEWPADGSHPSLRLSLTQEVDLVGGAKPCPQPAAPCDGVGIVDLMVREARNYVETTRRTHP